LLTARNPVVVFYNAIGDHLLTLPALRALAALYPGRLKLVCGKGARERFFSELALHSVFEADMQESATGRTFDAELAARVVMPCDLLISLNPWHSASMDRLLAMLKPAKSIGFYNAFQVSLPLDCTKHAAELAFDIPRFLDPLLKLDDYAEPPIFPSFYLDQAQRIRRVFPPNLRLMTLHVNTRPEKMWEPTRVESVLRDFVSRHPEFQLLNIDAKDPDFAFDDLPLLSCCGLPIQTAMYLVAQSDLFFGVDSCMLHAADLFRVPGVGLFGPTNIEAWGFRFGPGRHVCGNGSMKNITESAVLSALEDLLISAVCRQSRPDAQPMP
jgi:hypothetical protein